MIEIYTQRQQGERWLEHYRGQRPLFACVLGFTQTGLLPGISAAGATPQDRQYTAIADAEFLVRGPQPQARYPLPPLQAGASPVLISRSVVEGCRLPIYLFNAGLPLPPPVPAIDLGGVPAQCLTSGQAMPLATVEHLLRQGLRWGETLARAVAEGYLVIGECVVGGTTTALGVLTGLGVEATGKVNSSHPCCNHRQKQLAVEAGLRRSGLRLADTINPLGIVAAVGDPMQIVVAGIAIAASRTVGVMLAGGTQMLAIYALCQAVVNYLQLQANLERVVVGTTRWVAADPTGDTVGLAAEIGQVSLLATNLCFASSRYASLRAYEKGYVKEGVGAGGCAIAAHLYQSWTQAQLQAVIEALVSQTEALRMDSTVK